MTVTVTVADVDATNFITASQGSSEAFKTANLLKSLTVNALIFGESGTGKKTLARYILPDASVLDAADSDELLAALQGSAEVIVTHLENSPNLNTLYNAISQNNVRIVATCSHQCSHELLEELFSVQLHLPPLRERKEDVEALIDNFTLEAEKLFGRAERFDMQTFQPDLSENATSLRQQVFLVNLLESISENELMMIMERYLTDKLGSNSDYRKFLHLYEVPLLRAGLKRFKSQLQLSQRLGLNRNTLRKKIIQNSSFDLEV